MEQSLLKTPKWLILKPGVCGQKSVTRQVTFNRTKIDGNAKIEKKMRHFEQFSNNVSCYSHFWIKERKSCSAFIIDFEVHLALILRLVTAYLSTFPLVTF